MENPIKMDDLEVPLFSETSISALFVLHTLCCFMMVFMFGWWFLGIFFSVHPYLMEKRPNFDVHIFQMGWNHQPDVNWHQQKLDFLGHLEQFAQKFLVKYTPKV